MSHKSSLLCFSVHEDPLFSHPKITRSFYVQPKEWRDKYVKSFIPIAGPWAGSAKSLKVCSPLPLFCHVDVIGPSFRGFLSFFLSIFGTLVLLCSLLVCYPFSILSFFRSFSLIVEARTCVLVLASGSFRLSERCSTALLVFLLRV